MMPLADAKAIVELANDVAILSERVDGDEGRAVLEKHKTIIAEARRIVSSATSERARADVGDKPRLDARSFTCPDCGQRYWYSPAVTRLERCGSVAGANHLFAIDLRGGAR